MAFETNIPFKGEHSELSESSLNKFYNALGNHGVLIKSNYACKFEFFSPDTNYNEQLTFYCQSINIPGLKTSNTELFYKGRTIQIPTFVEQEHEFQMTILNDASGNMYAKMRGFLISYYSSKKSQRSIKNSKITIDSISDLVNYNGMQIVLKDITINNVSGLDLSHSDSSIQTFTVNGYCMFTEIYGL